MGRNLIIALTLFSAVFMVQSLSQEERDARDKCLKENGFSREPDYIGVDAIDIRTKCYAACALKAYGIMKEDGSIDLNKILEHISDTKNKNIDAKKALIIPCTEKKGENDCDTGYLITNCVALAARKLDKSSDK